MDAIEPYGAGGRENSSGCQRHQHRPSAPHDAAKTMPAYSRPIPVGHFGDGDAAYTQCYT
ncbi:hypothetical protein TYRP_000509 [Tyrophagus putrescentiae]|nr:hypothetical protein TYRP_000509 [Tyrophagus putrescentiae]